jgi:hypothetical protein
LEPMSITAILPVEWVSADGRRWRVKVVMMKCSPGL